MGAIDETPQVNELDKGDVDANNGLKNNQSTKQLQPEKGTFANKTDLSCRVHVKNLPFDATEKDIRSVFCVCGGIRAVDLVVTKDGKSRGMCNIDYFTADGAMAAIKQFDNQNVLGRSVTVALLEKAMETSSITLASTTAFVSKL